jgi:hypothetical protein
MRQSHAAMCKLALQIQGVGHTGSTMPTHLDVFHRWLGAGQGFGLPRVGDSAVAKVKGNIKLRTLEHSRHFAASNQCRIGAVPAACTARFGKWEQAQHIIMSELCCGAPSARGRI